MIQITPNYEILLTAILIISIVKIPLMLYAGVTHMERSTHYGNDAVVDAFLSFVVVLLVLTC